MCTVLTCLQLAWRLVIDRLRARTITRHVLHRPLVHLLPPWHFTSTPFPFNSKCAPLPFIYRKPEYFYFLGFGCSYRDFVSFPEVMAAAARPAFLLQGSKYDRLEALFQTRCNCPELGVHLAWKEG